MRPEGAAGKGGAIVNVASVAATIAFPGIAAYSATKSAVDRLTRVAAAESGRFGYGIRVNCVYPGLVPTAMGQGLAVTVAAAGLYDSPDEAVVDVIGRTPSGRLGTVEDMADCRRLPGLRLRELRQRHRAAGRRRNGHVSAGQLTPWGCGSSTTWTRAPRSGRTPRA